MDHSVMQVRMPIHNDRHKHYAFVAGELTFEKDGMVEVDGKRKLCTFHKSLKAGIYGFPNKEKRDKFINKCNGANAQDEIAFIASFGGAPQDL